MAWGLRAPYRQGAKWLMNSNTANAVDKLKDGDGRYLWREGMLAGVPPSLLGYTVEFSEDMPDVASGSLSIAFGNFQLAYVIVDKAGIRFLRDPFTDEPNLLFYAYRRCGGSLANSEALKLMKTGTS
jgi:HK97 family phage major capsid protein